MTNSPTYSRAFWTLSGLAILGPLSIDAFLPALESTAKGLNTDIGQIVVAFGFLAAGSGIGQIIYGPLSDRYGRKPVLVIGLIFYVLSAILSAMVTSIEPLYALRFIQGVAVASTMIIMRAIVRDLFGVREGAKLFANLFFVLALMPLIGPVIGGHLTIWFGWQSVFLLMAGTAFVAMLIIIFFFEESLQSKDVRAMTPRVLATSFKEIITDRTFVVFLLVGVGAYSGLFTVLAALAPVMTQTFGQPADIVGYQFAGIMSGHLVAALVAGKIVEKIGIRKMLYIATGISMIGGLLLIGFALAGISNIYAILLPTALHLFGFALTVAPMTAGALSNFQHMAGRATSLLGFLQQSAGAVISVILGLAADGTQLPMAIALASVSTFAFVIFVVLIPGTKLKAG